MEGVADVLQPLDINVMVLGRVALLYLFGEGGASKDVDIHPYPIGSRDLMDLYDQLVSAVEVDGGRVRWEMNGRSMIVFYPIEDRLIPMEFVLGGEDWITPEVLEDAVGTGSLSGRVLVPSPEHLLVMKAEAYYDRRAEAGNERFKDDMVQIVEGATRTGMDLNPQEVQRLILMRPSRKRAVMMDVCAAVMPV